MQRRQRPAGVIERKGRWYYRPTSERERLERRQKGLPETIPLGAAESVEARMRWAELTGRREPVAGGHGTVEELIRLWLAPGANGKPAALVVKENGRRRAESTVRQYRWIAEKVLLPRFGRMRYGKTAIEASRGAAIGTVDVQAYIAEIGTTTANVGTACLSSIFMWAKRTGRTTYNPCDGVAKIMQEGRGREPLAWEVESLGAMAEALGRRRLALMIDFESISGWSACDILGLQRRQFTHEGIRMARQKTGQRMLLQWSDDLKRIVGEALELPGARRAGVFPLSHVFASRSGKRVSGSTFWAEFRRLVERVNATLAAGVVDPHTLEAHERIAIEDLGFHDLRSKAGDDARDAGIDMHEFLGNTAAVANRHYARRERKVVPLPLKRS